MNFDHKVIIETTAEELWPLLTVPEKIRHWNPDIVSNKQLASGPPCVGAKSTFQIREGSRLVDYECEVLEYEPKQRVQIRLSGGSLGQSPAIITYTITSRANHVELMYSRRWKPVSLMLRIIAPAILGRRNARTALARLKSLADYA